MQCMVRYRLGIQLCGWKHISVRCKEITFVYIGSSKQTEAIDRNELSTGRIRAVIVFLHRHEIELMFRGCPE